MSYGHSDIKDMEDREIIARVSLLKVVKPRKEWVILTRQRIVGEELAKKHLFSTGIRDWVEWVIGGLQKPAFIIPLLAALVGGGAVWFHISPHISPSEKTAMPRERSPEQALGDFAIAQQKLDDLRVAAQQNNRENLSAAIRDFESNASRLSGSFRQIVENQPEKALQASKQIVQLQKEKSEVEKILGMRIGQEQEEEIDNTTKKLVERELRYSETRSLTEEQKELFEKAKAAVDQEDYRGALEYIWRISNPEK